jgi:hypothetical protein
MQTIVRNAMLQGSEQARISSGIRYAAAAIIMAHRKRASPGFSVSELTKLTHDWPYFFL